VQMQPEITLSDLKIESGFWYLASPYSRYYAGIDEAARIAAQIAGELTRRDIHVYSPIAETHAIAKAAGLDPLDHEMWMKRDAPFMAAAHGLIVTEMKGWHESIGLEEETNIFIRDLKPVFNLDPRILGVDP